MEVGYFEFLLSPWQLQRCARTRGKVVASIPILLPEDKELMVQLLLFSFSNAPYAPPLSYDFGYRRVSYDFGYRRVSYDFGHRRVWMNDHYYMSFLCLAVILGMRNTGIFILSTSQDSCGG
ncbi:hypothetical protein OUZ56_018512 [Daphnia magna]|uniref:Uncharacterized protein n=1 Tax=Daphnia magna TaxID=35525 RepID=A0ABQ9Z919_9CRUS|nr:hypothetical protein OUZ56_018512 [Daphnia magna]